MDLIHDWKEKYGIEGLKKLVVEKGYSAFTISTGEPSFPFAALKSFDYQLTPERCRKRHHEHPLKIYIYKRPHYKPTPAPPVGTWE